MSLWKEGDPLPDEMAQHQLSRVENRPPPFRIEGDRAALFVAVAKARAEFVTLEANQTADVEMKNGGKYSFDYADLSTLQTATVPALSKHGLVVIQPWWTESDGGISLLTMLCHESGAYISCEAYIAREGNWQQLSSGLTYAKRYAWGSILGISARKDDDDGNEAVGNNAAITPKRQAAGGKPDAQLLRIRELGEQLGWSQGQVQAHAAKAGIKKPLDMMNQAEGAVLIGTLTKQLEERKGAS